MRRQGIFGLKDVLRAVRGELIFGDLDDCFSGVSIDSRKVKRGEIFIAIKGERFDGHNFVDEAIWRGAACVIVSGDTPVLVGSRLCASVVTVRDTLAALRDLAYWHRKRFGLPVIAITGSNGKTTTKEMLGSLLSAKYKVLKNEGTQNNLIGLSLALLGLRADHEIAVIEMGTNHFGEIRQLAKLAAPNVGIITNIGPAHLEYFGDENGVFKEKWSLIEELAHPAIAVINADDELLTRGLSRDSGRVTAFTFGINKPADWTARRIIRRGRKIYFRTKNFPLMLNCPSAMNVYNALAAYSAARIFSVDASDIIRAFRGFVLPGSRFQFKNISGMNVIDDAYNANPASFACGLEAFSGLALKGRKIVVVADMLELGAKAVTLHKKAGEALGRSGVDMIIGVGSLIHIACDQAKACGFSPEAVYKCLSTAEAGRLISRLVRKGDNIFLKGSRAMRLEEIFKQTLNTDNRTPTTVHR